MKADVLDLTGKKLKSVDLPEQFNEEYNPDLIKRAVLVIRSNKRQPYGADPRAGKKSVGKLSRRRHDYKTAYGYGISRVPRKILTRRGTRFGWVGAFAPGIVGGRKAHPPKANKIFGLKINKKERKKAIRSAISSSDSIIIEDKIENLSKTKDAKKILQNFGLKNIERKIRAGRGKSRGRKYKIGKNILLVVSNKCKTVDSCGNIPGINIVNVKSLNAELLAPSGNSGRKTIWSEKSIEVMNKERLFL